MPFKIESEYDLKSDWLPQDAFCKIYDDRSLAIATAIEGVDDPQSQEVRVIDLVTRKVIFKTTEQKYQ